MMLRILLGISLCCVFSLSQAIEIISKQDKWIFDDSIRIPSQLDPSDPNSEQISLPANIYIPKTDDPDAQFPAIIFVSSWALNEYEYLDQAQQFAEKGYVVLNYTARGFWSSPGMIDTSGPADIFDCQRAIDYLLDPSNHLPVNPTKIGLGGVSYGAGITLTTAMVDSRVTAEAAMSGWGDLIESLWGGNTPNYTWLQILTTASRPIPFIVQNNPDPIIKQNYGYMRSHTNVEEVKAWGRLRSPIEYIDLANQRESKPAVFVSNNLHDYLFQPNSMIRFLQQYQGPWRAEFNIGTHAQAEAQGVMGIRSLIWTNVHLWFDHYLKDVDNGIELRKPLNTVVLNGNRRESFDSITPNDREQIFKLTPIDGEQGGQLTEINDPALDHTIELDIDTTKHLTYSGGVLGAIQSTDYHMSINDLDLSHGLIFKSQTLTETMHLRGSASVTFSAYTEDKAQYFAYLYYLDPETGKANWVTHAPFTCHQSEGCGLNSAEPSELTLTFYWTAVDFPEGSQVLLILDGKDEDYWRYPATPKVNHFIFSPDQPASVVIPVSSMRGRYDDPRKSETETPTHDASRGANGTAESTKSSVGGSGLDLLLMTLLVGLFRRRIN